MMHSCSLNEHSITTSGATLEHTASNIAVTVSDSLVSGTEELSLSQTVDFCFNYCLTNSVTNPVEIIRKLQENIVTGRDLEIKDVAECLEGDTNFIVVERGNLMQTAMSELNANEEVELRKTLEVQFYYEVSLLRSLVQTKKWYWIVFNSDVHLPRISLLLI